MDFKRTTSNSFVTSGQYALLESPPSINDRGVLEAFKSYAQEESKTSTAALASLIDPFYSTVKDMATRGQIHRYLWDCLLNLFKVRPLKAARPRKPLPKKVIIQLDNTLRRLRTPKDTTLLRTSEPLEVHLVVHLSRLTCPSTPLGPFVNALMAIQAIPCIDFIREDIDNLTRGIIEERIESVWEYVMKNEYVLNSGRTKTSVVTLYESQTALIDAVGRDDPLLVELATPPNSGKTMLAAALAIANPHHTIVFCCVVPGVFLHVARLWYFMGYYPTFVYGNRRVEPNFKLSRISWDPFSTQPLQEYLRCVVPKARCFIVDLNLCQWFVEQLDPMRTILFMDEPTLGLDGCPAFEHVPNMVARMFKSEHLPKTIVLSSATLPPRQDLLPLTSMWRSQFPSGDVIRIEHAVLTSSISIIDADTGHLVFPHMFCKSAAELQSIIGGMQKNIVALKAYSGPAALMLRRAYSDVYGASPPAFCHAGLSAHNLNLGSIREYVRHLLIEVCKDYRQEFISWKPPKAPFPPIALDDIALNFSPHVPGQTLIAGRDTVGIARCIARSLVAERTIKGLELAMKHEEVADKMFKNAASKIKDPDERLDFEQSQEYKSPTTYIPEELVIHTAAHLRKYGGRSSDFPKEFLRRQPAVSVIRKVIALNIPESDKHAFLAGVVHTDARMHTDSTSPLIGMLEGALLDGVPVAVVDLSFTYGINVPASNVYVTPEFASTASRNTIIQFINRVNRTGAKSHNGKAFLCPEAIHRLFSLEPDTVEAERLVRACEEEK